MNKVNFVRKIPKVLSSLLLSILFVSCQNFLNGNSFLDKLEDNVDYANAAEYNISVASTNTDWGTITSGAGDHKKKVSDYLSFSFSLNDGYKFLKWKAVNNSNHSVSMEEYVEFTDQTQTSARARLIKGSNDILITPVCAQLFAVIDDFTSDGAAIYNRDSTIVITFNQNLAESTEEINNVENISIGISGLTESAEYFNSPVINDNRIIISCNTEKLIPVAENSTRTVTVTIPSDFCYFYDGHKMELEQKYVLSYVIDFSTTEKSNIKFTNNQDGDSNAVFTVDGVTVTGSTAKYSIGQIINLSYKNSSDYVFVGFASDIPEAVLFSDIEFDEVKKTYVGKVIVLQGGLDFSITPVSTLRDKVTIKFDAENGSVTPAEQKSFYKDENFDLKFVAANGYAFYEWKLFDYQNNELNLSDYLKIDAKKDEQSVKVKTAGTVLTLKGVAVQRPQVKFTIPGNGKEGLVRNATIKILFTQQMDKSTLNKNNIKVTQGLLRSTEQEISMDAQDASNLLDYVINEAGDLLTIRLKSVTTLYQPNAYVTVTISKDVKDALGISFAGNYEFQFQVSNNIDSLAPVINKLEAGINVINSTDVKNYKTFSLINYNTAASAFSREIKKSQNEIQNFYNSDKVIEKKDNVNVYNFLTNGEKINIYVQAGDIIGSGNNADRSQSQESVSKIGYRITSALVNSSSGNLASSGDTFDYQNYFDYDTNHNELAKVDGYANGTTLRLDLTNLDGNGLEAPDGLVRIDIFAIDKNDNSGLEEEFWYVYGNGYQTFYVLKDHYAPTISMAKWEKTYFDTEAMNVLNCVKNDSAIKFKVDEEFSGIKELNVELINTESKIYRPESVVICYDSSNFNRNSGTKLSDISYSSENGLVSFNKTKENASDLRAHYTGNYWLKNIIDGSIPDGDYKLKINISDAAGNTNSISTNITVDRTPPELNENGPKVKDKYFNSSNYRDKIYPAIGKRGITGQSFHDKIDLRNADGMEIRWFYTNAYKDTTPIITLDDFIQSFEGEVKYSQSHGIIHYQHSSDTLNDNQLKGINQTSILSRNPKCYYTNQSTPIDKYFTVGTHSVLAVDDAGNVSDKAITFVVVQDNVRPVRTTSEKYRSNDKNVELNDLPGDYLYRKRDLKYLFTLDTACQVTISNVHDEKWNRSTGNNRNFLDWWAKTQYTTHFTARKVTLKETSSGQIKNSKIVMKVTGTESNQKFITNKPDSNLTTIPGEYWEDAWPSRTSSGIKQYYISRTYNEWRSYYNEKLNTNCWQPTFPAGTDLSSITKDSMRTELFLSNIQSEFVCCNESWVSSAITGITYNSYFNGSWVDYNVNEDGDIEIPVWHSPFPNSNINYHYGAPISVCFKDGCGNLSYVVITKPTWSEYSTFAYRFDFYGESY